MPTVRSGVVSGCKHLVDALCDHSDASVLRQFHEMEELLWKLLLDDDAAVCNRTADEFVPTMVRRAPNCRVPHAGKTCVVTLVGLHCAQVAWADRVGLLWSHFLPSLAGTFKELVQGATIDADIASVASAGSGKQCVCLCWGCCTRVN